MQSRGADCELQLVFLFLINLHVSNAKLALHAFTDTLFNASISCTEPSWACPSYCSSSATFWRLLARCSVSFTRHLARQHFAVHCCLTAPGRKQCAPDTCVCGAQVDSSGTHGLACRKSAGRHIRHNAVNDLIKRALASTDIPAMLEPSSL